MEGNTILTTLILLFVGLALLLAGGTAMVRGASDLAESYGVSPLVIGLTVVAFGTSAPELVVNILGALRGESALAFGNITGSNIANIGLVLGLSALFTPIAIQGQITRRELPLLLLATAVVLVMALDPLLRNTAPVLDRSDGIVLLMLFGIFLYFMFTDFITQQEDPLRASLDTRALRIHKERPFNWGLIAGGIVGLALGAQMTISNGVALAAAMGVPSVIIGMFVVAVGTSLPELITSVIAARRGESDLCVGNVIGSNLFNTMFVLPISALVHPLAVPEGGIVDLVVTFLFALVLIPVFIYRDAIMSKRIGGVFLVAYAIFMLGRIGFS